ncbi:hypothetical protein V6B33_15840 [Mangrovibacillus sp. Mu-81]|uniref:hypothetical protein n=1 Tax=Mangrovibacillus sp. Mu-81 TaxID=3121478 RepID=UPI002FE470EF
MVWFLILLTVVTYGFIMKHVLSNIMKDRHPVRKKVPYQKSPQSFAPSSLITTESTR